MPGKGERVISLAEGVVGLVDLDRKVKATSGQLGMARRWSRTHPDRWPPEKIRHLENELADAQTRLRVVMEALAA